MTTITAGVDEVGRGCLYGPVVAAAVVFPPTHTLTDETWRQIKDSKKLSAKKRAELAIYIKNVATTYGIGVASVEEIDEVNILQATMRAMHRALDEAYQKHTFEKLHVDGTYFIPYKPAGAERQLTHSCLVGGDATDISIAAASIIAKEYRDSLVQKLVQDNPEHAIYGLKTNMGYGTKKHIEALHAYGPTHHHRKTFAPISTIISASASS